MSAVISLPNRAQPFVVTVSALYAAAIVVGVLTTQVTASNVTSFAVLVGCALVSIEGSLRLVWSGPKAGRSTNDLLAVWTIPVVLLLPPLYGALVVVPIFAFLQLRVGKRPLVKLLFSISAAGLANFVAASLHRAFVADPTRWDVHSLVGTPGALAAIVVCVAVRHVINMGLVAESWR